MNSLNLLAEFASESENEGALEVVRVQSLSLVGKSEKKKTVLQQKFRLVSYN